MLPRGTGGGAVEGVMEPPGPACSPEGLDLWVRCLEDELLVEVSVKVAWKRQ